MLKVYHLLMLCYYSKLNERTFCNNLHTLSMCVCVFTRDNRKFSENENVNKREFCTHIHTHIVIFITKHSSQHTAHVFYTYEAG